MILTKMAGIMTKRSNKKNPFFRDKSLPKKQDLKQSKKDDDAQFAEIMKPYETFLVELEKIKDNFKETDSSIEELYTRQRLVEDSLQDCILRMSLIIANLSGFEVGVADE